MNGATSAGTAQGAAGSMIRITAVGSAGTRTASHAVAPADPDHQAGDGRVQMEVLVGIDVVERQAGAREGVELRLDLGRELALNARPEEHVGAAQRHVGAEQPVPADEIGHSRGRQHRRGLDEGEMQPDAQARQPLGAGDGVGTGRRSHHQARGGEDALRMGQLDRLVDLASEAEIVGGDDEVLHRRIASPARREEPEGNARLTPPDRGYGAP